MTVGPRTTKRNPSDLDALIRDLRRLSGRSRREAAEALETLRVDLDAALAREAALREALAGEERIQRDLHSMIDDGDDFGEHVGLQTYRRTRYEGRGEVLAVWRASLASSPPAGEAS